MLIWISLVYFQSFRFLRRGWKGGSSTITKNLSKRWHRSTHFGCGKTFRNCYIPACESFWMAHECKCHTRSYFTPFGLNILNFQLDLEFFVNIECDVNKYTIPSEWKLGKSYLKLKLNFNFNGARSRVSRVSRCGALTFTPILLWYPATNIITVHTHANIHTPYQRIQVRDEEEAKKRIQTNFFFYL